MPLRLPNPNSPEEVRRAFGEMKRSNDIIDQGASGEVLVGQGVGATPAWGTILTSITLLIVDSITIDGATITSDTGAISFDNENLSTTGTITGVNVTSGANPGHTHTGVSLSDIDISDDTNLAVTAPIVLTDDTLSLNQSGIDHGTLGGLADDDHTQYHTDARAAIWLAANHETTYNHGQHDTAYGWGNHASGGYLKANGSVPLTADWATGIFSIICTDHLFIQANWKSIYFGAGNDSKIMYTGADLLIYPRLGAGTGNLHIPAGSLGVGTSGGALSGSIDVSLTTSVTAASAIGIYSTVFYGSAGSGNTSKTVYGAYCNAQTAAAYDGNVAGLQGFRNVSIHKGSGTITNMYGGGFAISAQAGSGAVTNMYGLHASLGADAGAGVVANMYGLYIENVNTASTLNYAIYTKLGTVYHEGSVGINVAAPDEKLQVAGNIHVDDNYKMIFGTGKDADIYYSDSHLIIDPDVVGSGKLIVAGSLQATDYYSGDGTQGATASVAVAKVGGGTRTLNFKDGLYIDYTDS